jgi:hypothetical protein
MERGVWGERLKKSFHFKYKIKIFVTFATFNKIYLYLIFQ